MRAVDVEVVGIGRGNHGHVGKETQERTVELVGLDSKPVAGAEHEVAAEILGNTAQKGRSAARDSTVEPCHERRGGGFAMGAGDGHHVLALGQVTQHLRTLLDGEAVFAEVTQLAVLLRDSRSVDHDRVVRIEKFFGNGPYVVIIMHRGPFGLQFGGQTRGGAVVAGHEFAHVQKIAGQGAHADAPDAQKIDFRKLHATTI